MSSAVSTMTYADAKKKALSLVNAFKTRNTGASRHYPKVFNKDFADALTKTINNQHLTLDQGTASLCGPAAFYYVLVNSRPDLYSQAAIDLFLNGEAKIGSLKLKSSKEARSRNPSSLSGLDWAVFTGVKPSYDNVEERMDGITLPGKLRKWFERSGFSAVEMQTSKVFTKGIKHLLAAQVAHRAGYSICLFVDADIFFSTGHSKKGKESTFPNHWVVLNSDIKIAEYDSSTKSNSSPVVISQSVLDRLEAADEKSQKETRVVLDVFTWGERQRPAASRTSPLKAPMLDYFLRGFHGYIKVKR